MIKYCPICNRSSDEVRFVGEFCEVCATKKVKEKVADSVTIERCKACQRIKTPEGYQQLEKSTLKSALIRALHTKCSIKIDSFDEQSALVKFSCDMDGNEGYFEKKIAIVFKKTMCLDCYRKTSGYFEALFQIRGNRDSSDKMMKKFLHFIEIRDAFASRIDELENGYDIYSSNKVIATKFFQYYDLKPVRAYTLYGTKKGKKLYRNIYLLRL